MSPNEGARYLASLGKDSQPRREEFFRFVERFRIEPIDKSASIGARKGDVTLRQKWSKKHIDLCLMTGLPFPEALAWLQKSSVRIGA